MGRPKPKPLHPEINKSRDWIEKIRYGGQEREGEENCVVSADRWLDSVRLEVGSLGWNETPSKDIETASYLQRVRINAIIQVCAMDLVCGVWFHCWLDVYSCWRNTVTPLLSAKCL